MMLTIEPLDVKISTFVIILHKKTKEHVKNFRASPYTVLAIFPICLKLLSPDTIFTHRHFLYTLHGIIKALSIGGMISGNPLSRKSEIFLKIPSLLFLYCSIFLHNTMQVHKP